MHKRLAGILDSFRNARVAVIGDIMLDEYIIGDTDRISPESPVPVIREERRSCVPGGASNVAVNIHALGADVTLLGVVGADADGDKLIAELNARGIGTGSIYRTQNRPTTRKTRLIARGSQMLRVDNETTEPIDEDTAKRLSTLIEEADADVIVVSDYAKGVVTPDLMSRLTSLSGRIVVDPKSPDFGLYRSCYVIKPNHREILQATGLTNPDADELEVGCRSLMEAHDVAALLVTMGPQGMVLYERGRPPYHIKSRAREVYDVTGAGDTVAAVMAGALSAGVSLQDSCEIANMAAGLVVGKRQTATVTCREILEYAFGVTASEKIIPLPELLDRIEDIRKDGLKIVFTNGCFDLLHVGHISYLNEARRLGDVLIVGLNTDRSIRALKGPSRPIIPEEERSHVLAALESVNYVVLFDEDTPVNLIEKIRPDILVKGADYTREEVVGYDIVESYGGQVKLIELTGGASTSAIIERIRNSQS